VGVNAFSSIPRKLGNCSRCSYSRCEIGLRQGISYKAYLAVTRFWDGVPADINV